MLIKKNGTLFNCDATNLYKYPEFVTNPINLFYDILASSDSSHVSEIIKTIITVIV